MNKRKIISIVFTIAFFCLATGFEQASRAQHIDSSITQVKVSSSIARIADIINDNYFDSEVAKQIRDGLQLNLANHEYENVKTKHELAKVVTQHLFMLTQDKHLIVAIREDANQNIPTKTDDIDQRRERAAKRINFGIQKVEIMPGNIGYVNITSFFRANEAGDALAAAMATIADVDVVIIDMRNNQGGAPDTVALLSSYFFEKPEKKMFDIVSRSGDVRSYATSPDIANPNENRPLYILTGSRTFSAGEGFAFIMQDQGRAIIVGATTAGAANPGKSYDVNQLFKVMVPNGRVRAAIGGDNWEGKGVAPDVETDEGDALDVARRLAIKKLTD